MNLIHENRESLGERHYVRRARRRWWFDLPKSRLDEKVRKSGGDFCLILYGSLQDQHDFYVIPYALMRPMLIESFLQPRSATHGPRWIGNVEDHHFSISRCPDKLDLRANYGNVGLLLRTGASLDNTK